MHKMKKFSKIVENKDNEKHYKISAHVDLIVPAENTGEAGYLADSILSSIEYGSDYVIDLIEETNEEISIIENHKPISKSNDKTTEEIIELSWEKEFGEKNPTREEKMEFYHKLRKSGIDDILIFKVLGGKF